MRIGLAGMDFSGAMASGRSAEIDGGRREEGSVVGAILGARILMAVSNERIRVLFVVVLVALAAQMLLEAFGIDLLGGGA